MDASQLTRKKAFGLAVKLLVMLMLLLGPLAQSATAGSAVPSGTAGHDQMQSEASSARNHVHHRDSHAGSDAGSSEKPAGSHGDTHGDFANCCELLCVGSALVITHLDLPNQMPSAVIHARSDAGMAIGEWATPHRPPQRLI